MRKIRRFLALLLIATFSVIAAGAMFHPQRFAIANAQVNPFADRGEIRGVWLTNIDSDAMYSPISTKLAVNRLARLNFNTIYPTVWQGGYTLYPSPVAERVFGTSLDPHPELQGRDVLREIVKEGHKKGLAVIPWFEFGFMAPAESELARQHPE